MESPDILSDCRYDLVPEPVITAMHERIQHGVFGYPLGIGGRPEEIAEFCQTLVERMERLYHWQIEPQDIVLMPGVITALNLACHALVSPQEAVLVQTPVYPPILHAAQTTGILGQEMELPRQPDGSYAIDWDAFEASITPPDPPVHSV
jgi:cystathionine beta-lyase